MILRRLISLSLLLIVQAVCAQSADDYFHSGAQCYLTNNIDGARDEVDAGLKYFPDDIKLKKLDELLKQQSQQQQQQKQQNQKNEQSKQDQKSEQQKSEEQKQQ